MALSRKIILFVALILAILSAAGVYLFGKLQLIQKEEKIEMEERVEGQTEKVTTPLSACLPGDKLATYENDKSDFVGKLKILIKEKKENKIASVFYIDDVMLRNYHPVEIHKCGVYVLRSFNDDYKLSKTLPGFSKELWFYNYKNNGNLIIQIAGENKQGEPEIYYSYDFRVSSDEKYLVLEKSYLGKDDYSLVIKDLNTKEDAFVLRLKDVLTQHPDVIPGTFGLGIWTEDGKYLRGDIFQGALSTAYYQIEAGTWKTDIFAAPEDILAGVERAVNFNNWRLAYVDIPTFVGVEEVYRQIIKEAKEQGKRKNLFVYNLKTKEKTGIASADPEWRFNIKWLSDTELEYELPSGEREIYEIAR